MDNIPLVIGLLFFAYAVIEITKMLGASSKDNGYMYFAIGSIALGLVSILVNDVHTTCLIVGILASIFSISGIFYCFNLVNNNTKGDTNAIIPFSFLMGSNLAKCTFDISITFLLFISLSGVIEIEIILSGVWAACFAIYQLIITFTLTKKYNVLLKRLEEQHINHDSDENINVLETE